MVVVIEFDGFSDLDVAQAGHPQIGEIFGFAQLEVTKLNPFVVLFAKD